VSEKNETMAAHLAHARTFMRESCPTATVDEIERGAQQIARWLAKVWRLWKLNHG